MDVSKTSSTVRAPWNRRVVEPLAKLLQRFRLYTEAATLLREAWYFELQAFRGYFLQIYFSTGVVSDIQQEETYVALCETQATLFV